MPIDVFGLSSHPIHSLYALSVCYFFLFYRTIWFVSFLPLFQPAFVVIYHEQCIPNTKAALFPLLFFIFFLFIRIGLRWRSPHYIEINLVWSKHSPEINHGWMSSQSLLRPNETAPSCCFFFDQLFRDGRFIFGSISKTDKQLNNHIEILKAVHFNEHLRKQP